MKIRSAPAALDASSMLERARAHPDISRAGMILLHNGIVRAFDLEGRSVSRIDVDVNEDCLSEILERARAVPGIVFVDVEICRGCLYPGDDVMLLCVAGDIRTTVISVMKDTLDAIKSSVTAKKEHVT